MSWGKLRLCCGILLTTLYLVIVIYYPFYVDKTPESLNEWGDYLAGFLAPIAIFWFIATLALQRQELSLQRKELKLSREVLVKQNELQLRIAEETTSNRFAESVSKHTALFDLQIVEIFSALPKGYNIIGQKEVSELDYCITYFDYLRTVSVGIENADFPNEVLPIIKHYYQSFGVFRDKAIATDNLVYILGKHHDLWVLLGGFLDTEN